jgi:hypothetical protein
MLSGIFLGIYIVIAGFPRLKKERNEPGSSIHEAP